MSNPWSSLNLNFGVTEDSFNEVVGNSRYLDIGTHENVYIEGIEPATARNGNPFLRVIWSNDEKQTARDSVFMVGKPDDNGTPQPHFTLRRLMGALIPDRTLRLEFMSKVKANPALFAGLVGLRATIKIGEGREGYTVKEAPTGGYLLWDVETKAQIGTEVFESYKAANEKAKDDGLKRAFTNIVDIQASAGAEENQRAVQAIITAGTKPATGAAGVRAVPVSGTRGSF